MRCRAVGSQASPVGSAAAVVANARSSFFCQAVSNFASVMSLSTSPLACASWVSASDFCASALSFSSCDRSAASAGEPWKLAAAAASSTPSAAAKSSLAPAAWAISINRASIFGLASFRIGWVGTRAVSSSSTPSRLVMLAGVVSRAASFSVKARPRRSTRAFNTRSFSALCSVLCASVKSSFKRARSSSTPVVSPKVRVASVRLFT